MAQRIKLEVTLVGEYKFSTKFGTTHIYKMKDAEGRVYVWKTSGYLAYEPIIEECDGVAMLDYIVIIKNDVIEITASVKGKDEYNGEPQTLLNRVKVTKIIKAHTPKSVIIANKKKLGQLKGNEFLVKTIVTTEVIRKIAEKNGVELRDCYTGFKWIANEIRISEGKQKYIGGGEESFGFLPFDKVRDKDSPASICLICEIAAWAKDNGKTLYDLLMDIYAEYGFSKEFTVNVVRPGKTGADEIKQMMADFRATPPADLGGSKVVLWKDYQTLEARKADGTVEKIDMPDTSNVLQWFCDDDTKVSVRPSGTEPKIKFYIEVKDPSFRCAGCYERCTAAAEEKIEAIKKSLGL